MVKQNKNEADRKRRPSVYVPDVLEAATLKELGSFWRNYSSHEEFAAEKQKHQAKTSSLNLGTEQEPRIIETNDWDMARGGVLSDLGFKVDEDYNPQSLDNAENQLRADKELWDKLQAALLYNSAGFRPEIELEDVKNFASPTEIYAQITQKISGIKKGKFIDGRYEASKDEKNIRYTLQNYGRFVRFPQTAEQVDIFYDNLKKQFSEIMKRTDYRSNNQRSQTRKEKTMSDATEEAVVWTDDEKDSAKKYGLDLSQYKSRDEYLAAAKKRIDELNNRSSGENGGTDPNTERAKQNAEEKSDEPNTESAEKPLKCTEKQPEPEERPKGENIPEWVKKKNEYYSKLAENNEIKDYEWDKSKEGFAAKLEGTEIHYSTPDNVDISSNASYKVFDVMLKEEDNKGRPVEFQENTSKQFATRLYAACVLNGNPMRGAVPKKLDLEELNKCGLDATQIEAVKKHLETSKQQEQQKTATEQPQTNEANATEKPQLSSQAKDDVARLQEIRKKFNQMKIDEKISRGKDHNGKPIFVAGAKGTAQDVEESVKIMDEATKIVKTGLENNRGKSHKLDTKEKQDSNEAYRKEQIETIRARLGENHDNNVQKREDRADMIRAARMGIAPETITAAGKEVKPLKGAELESYKQKMDPAVMQRVKRKFGNNGKE